MTAEMEHTVCIWKGSVEEKGKRLSKKSQNKNRIFDRNTNEKNV